MDASDTLTPGRHALPVFIGCRFGPLLQQPLLCLLSDSVISFFPSLNHLSLFHTFILSLFLTLSLSPCSLFALLSKKHNKVLEQATQSLRGRQDDNSALPDYVSEKKNTHPHTFKKKKPSDCALQPPSLFIWSAHTVFHFAKLGLVKFSALIQFFSKCEQYISHSVSESQNCVINCVSYTFSFLFRYK